MKVCIKPWVWGLFFSLLASICSAQQVVLPLYEKWIEFDGSGFAMEVYQAALEQTNLSVKNNYRPLKRALIEFKNEKHDCFLSGDEQAVNDYIGISVVSSKPILKIRHVAYTLRNQPKVISRNSLRGKIIGVLRGTETGIYNLGDLNVRYEVVERLTQNIAMLKDGRIDVIIGISPNENQLVQDLHFDQELFFYKFAETLNCHPRPKNTAFIERFNLGLDVIKKNGIYQKIFSRYYE